jgi:ribosome maturation factor RimP
MAALSRDRVRSALLPIVSGAGFDLEDVSVTPAGRRQVVRVVVDRDGGLDLDAVAEVARVVSDALDSDDVTGSSPYTLEVSSPGVDRPLTEPRHWRRATGRLVAVGGLIGRVLAADDRSVTLDIAGDVRDIGYDDIGPGTVQVEFDHRPEPEPEPNAGAEDGSTEGGDG